MVPNMNDSWSITINNLLIINPLHITYIPFKVSCKVLMYCTWHDVYVRAAWASGPDAWSAAESLVPFSRWPRPEHPSRSPATASVWSYSEVHHLPRLNPDTCLQQHTVTQYSITPQNLNFQKNFHVSCKTY